MKVGRFTITEEALARAIGLEGRITAIAIGECLGTFELRLESSACPKVYVGQEIPEVYIEQTVHTCEHGNTRVSSTIKVMQ